MISDSVAAAKMNGLGNAILIMDMRGRRQKLAAAFVRALAQNPQSRFDQLMALRNPEAEAGEQAEAAATLYRAEIYNADGSQARACGNGTRCLAAWLYRQDSRITAFHFLTAGGLVRARRREDGRIEADMGEARFAASAVPLSFAPADMLRVPLARLLPPSAAAADFQAFPQSAAVLSVGNPHAVFFTAAGAAQADAPSDEAFARFGAALERSPAFPQGVNVSLAQILSRGAIRLRVWERGAGLTKACGTAACAAQAAAHKAGLTDAAAEVILPGGRLQICMEGGRCIMAGATEYEYSGRVDLKTAAFTKGA